MAEKTTIVIFGASGDLTQRKLVPALFSLYLKGRLPEGVRIVGFAYDPLSREEFHARLRLTEPVGSSTRPGRGAYLGRTSIFHLTHGSPCPLSTRFGSGYAFEV